MSQLLERSTKRRRLVRRRTKLRPEVGLVLGSGLGAFADTLEDADRHPLRRDPALPASTAVGHEGELVLGRSRGVPVAVMAGRVHFYEGYTPRAGGVPRAGAGPARGEDARRHQRGGQRQHGLRARRPDDHRGPHQPHAATRSSGPNDDALGQRFFDMSEAYDTELRDIAEAACRAAGVRSHRASTSRSPGPPTRRPPRSAWPARWAPTPSACPPCPEVIAARHMGIRVLGLSCITNMAAGVSTRSSTTARCSRSASGSRRQLLDVLARIVQEAAART